MKITVVVEGLRLRVSVSEDKTIKADELPNGRTMDDTTYDYFR